MNCSRPSFSSRFFAIAFRQNHPELAFHTSTCMACGDSRQDEMASAGGSSNAVGSSAEASTILEAGIPSLIFSLAVLTQIQLKLLLNEMIPQIFMERL